MGACTGFIFAALLEFTLTNYLWRKGTKQSKTQQNPTGRSLNSNSKEMGPIAAAASSVASGLDPSMFTQMMSGNTLCTIFTILLTFWGKSCNAHMLHASGVYYSYIVLGLNFEFRKVIRNFWNHEISF